MPYMVIKKYVYISIKNPRLDENLNLNAFHNNKKKLRLTIVLIKYRGTTAINKEDFSGT